MSLLFHSFRISLVAIAALLCLSATSWAQQGQRPFEGYFTYADYEVYLRLNVYEQDITIPGQELYGQLPGYLSREQNAFSWPVVEAEVVSDKTPVQARLTLINDFGSEDCTCMLTQVDDSTYTLRQLSGATLKVARQGKWQKLPKEFTLKRRPKK